VGPLSFLRKFFGGGPSGAANVARDGGIYVRVQCNACGEIVQTRVNPSSELSLEDDGHAYFVRKVLVGQQCFRPIEVELRYSDLRGTEIGREVRGGTSVS
jgi:hypothetical protein